MNRSSVACPAEAQKILHFALQGRTLRAVAAPLPEDFAGWEKGGHWSDFSFQQQHDEDIDHARDRREARGKDGLT